MAARNVYKTYELTRVMETTKKNDFIELSFSAYANGELFDSTKKEEVQKLNPKAEAKPIILSVGQGMVVTGLDKALEGKEIGKEYEITLKPKDAFGERKRELVRIVSLSSFTDRKINPYAGMTLALDNTIVKITSVSGGRVTVDFNNPLAGKEVVYKFTITRKVTDEKEKASALFELVFKTVPEFEIGDKIIVRGQKMLEVYVKAFSSKFKEILGKDLEFKEEAKKPEEKKEETAEKKEEGNAEEKTEKTVTQQTN
jgi:FKBP-type peptidyl-prolyl cis-trans isomerase 2